MDLFSSFYQFTYALPKFSIFKLHTVHFFQILLFETCAKIKLYRRLINIPQGFILFKYNMIFARNLYLAIYLKNLKRSFKTMF